MIPDHILAKARAVRLEDELARRGHPMKGGTERAGPCPRCGGRDRFSVNTKKQLWNCRGCGKGGDIVSLIEHLDEVGFAEAVEKLSGEKIKPNGRDNAKDDTKRVVVARFDYQDENGDLLYQVERVEYRNPDGSWLLNSDGKRKKDFPQRRPDGNGGWIYKRGDTRSVPYRLPEIIEAISLGHPIIVAEGEAKANLFWSWNIPATCNPGGAGKWTDELSQHFIGANVVGVGDNDERGREHLDTAGASLVKVAASVRVLELPGVPYKGDVIDWAKAGGTAEQFVSLLEREAKTWEPSNGSAGPFLPQQNGQDQSKINNPVKLFSYTEMIALPQTEWAIHGVLPLRSKTVIFGQSDSFKSFLAVDMACSIATGRSWHGHDVKQRKVVYIANEGANAVGRKRIPAWMAYHAIPREERDNIFLVKAETILPNEASRANLLAAIRAVIKPDEDFVIPIDVLRGTMTGSESDDEAAHAWTSAAEILIEQGATILTVTHSPYGEDGRMRGHSHLWGSFDTRLHCEANKEALTAVLKVNRHKDHDSSGQWGFQLDVQEIDEAPGETSLVPRMDKEARAKTGKKKLRPAAKLARETLIEALLELGKVPPASDEIPSNVEAVTIKQWGDKHASRTGGDMGDKSCPERRAFFRGKAELQDAGMIGISKPYVWVTGVTK